MENLRQVAVLTQHYMFHKGMSHLFNFYLISCNQSTSCLIHSSLVCSLFCLGAVYEQQVQRRACHL